MTAISRHFHIEHYQSDNIETHIQIYADQVNGWFLDQAHLLQKVSDHSGFMVLMVAMSFLEGHAIFLKGEDSYRRSGEFFKYAFNKIFPITSEDDPVIKNKALDELYDQVRCGLFHTGITKDKVFLVDDPVNPLTFDYQGSNKEFTAINVNPHLMLRTIDLYFSKYIFRLLNPNETELRTNFEKAWQLRQNPPPKPSSHLKRRPINLKIEKS